MSYDHHATPYADIIAESDGESEYHIVDEDESLELSYWENRGEDEWNELIVQDYDDGLLLQYIDKTDLSPLELDDEGDVTPYGTDTVDIFRMHSMEEIRNRIKNKEGSLKNRIADEWHENAEIRQKDKIRDILGLSDENWRHMVSKQMSDYNSYRWKLIDHMRR